MGLEQLLESMRRPEEIQELERAYELSFTQDESLQSIVDDIGDSQEWLDKGGDHGVAEFKEMTIPEI